MARCKLKDNGNEVEFSPLVGYDIAEDRSRSIIRSRSGVLFINEWGSKNSYSIPVTNISTADGLQINTWWQNMTTLTFTPDLALPAQTVSVKIINETRPLQMLSAAYWKDKYTGTLELRQP